MDLRREGSLVLLALGLIMFVIAVIAAADKLDALMR